MTMQKKTTAEELEFDFGNLFRCFNLNLSFLVHYIFNSHTIHLQAVGGDDVVEACCSATAVREVAVSGCTLGH